MFLTNQLRVTAFKAACMLSTCRFVRTVVSLVIPLYLVGCRGTDETSSTPATNKPQAASSTATNISQDVANSAAATTDDIATIRVSATPLAKDDPAAQGWQTEVFNDAASNQLKKIGELISGELAWSEHQSHLIDVAFRSTPLRPANLQVVYEQNVFRILRPAAGQVSAGASVSPDGSDVGKSSAGASDSQSRNSQQTFSDLLAGLTDVTDVRTKFKIFRVTLDGSQATTATYFQLYAKHAGGTFQCNATWQCAWTGDTQNEPLLAKLEVTDYEEVWGDTDLPAMFSDCTEAVVASAASGPAFDDQLRMGIDYWLNRIETRHGIDIGGWQGIVVGDVNGDNLDDLYVCQPGGLPNRMYVQQPDGTAKEMSAAAGVDWMESTHGALLVDLDNDGDQDLLVAIEAGVLVMSNNGQGQFTVRSANVLPAAIPYSLSAADFDQDGDLDIYVCCYNLRSGINRHLLFARPVPYHDANNGGRNVLLRTDSTPESGPWRFRYATGLTGLDQNNRRFSYASAWEDFDNDGDLDLYVANDFGRNNLYRNDQGTFTDVANQAQVEDIGPGMSSSWGDYNNDGNMDLYVSNMFSSAGNRIATQGQFHSAADSQTKTAFLRHARGNSLFANQGDGSFQDIAESAHVVLGRWAWGSKFADLNNDGWQDLIVTNGFITQPDAGDL